LQTSAKTLVDCGLGRNPHKSFLNFLRLRKIRINLVSQKKAGMTIDPARTEAGMNAPPTGKSGLGSALTFFLLTFAVTWSCWIPIVTVPIPAHSFLRAVLLFVGIFSPSLVALALTARVAGEAGVRVLLSRMFKWEVGARWYLFAVGYTLSIKLFVTLVYRITSGAWPKLGTVPLYIIPFAILISTPVQSGEEIGWRGYALPRLGARLGLGWASIILGIIWACWHLPLFFLPDSDTYHQSFIVYVTQVTAISVAMAWLWERTGRSLLLTMLMHAAINNTQDIIPSAVSGGTKIFGFSASPLSWLAAAVLWICAAYFLVRMRGHKEKT
jgi:CAAX protease family protein